MFWTIGDKDLAFVQNQRISQQQTIKAVALSRAGTYLATGSLDQKVRVWDLTQNPPQARAQFNFAPWARSVHLTPDNAYLVAFSSGLDITLWNLGKGQVEQTWKFMPR